MKIIRLLIIALALICQTPKAEGQSLSSLYHLARGAVKMHQALNVSKAELQNYMKESMVVEDGKHEVCAENDAYTIRLKKVVRGMKTIDGVPLNFKVYKDEQTANAFASPDGSIRVYSKLMDLMTDDELLGIIGHELGHIACHHSLKEYKAGLMLSAAREGLMMSDGSIGEFAASQLGDVAEYMINAKYSREKEIEADDFAFEYLVALGKNPYIMARALAKLQKLGSDSNNKYYRYVNSMFSSHPDLQKRVERLQQKAKAVIHT